MPLDSIFDDGLSDEPLFESEAELKKQVKILERQIKKEQRWHDAEIASLREQIRDLITKNMDLTEANKIFAKGLEYLKREQYTVTETHMWFSGGKTMKERIIEITGDLQKRVVAITPLRISPQGHLLEAIIVTEYISKTKPQPTKLFKD